MTERGRGCRGPTEKACPSPTERAWPAGSEIAVAIRSRHLVSIYDRRQSISAGAQHHVRPIQRNNLPDRPGGDAGVPHLHRPRARHADRHAAAGRCLPCRAPGAAHAGHRRGCIRLRWRSRRCRHQPLATVSRRGWGGGHARRKTRNDPIRGMAARSRVVVGAALEAALGAPAGQRMGDSTGPAVGPRGVVDASERRARDQTRDSGNDPIRGTGSQAWVSRNDPLRGAALGGWGGGDGGCAVGGVGGFAGGDEAAAPRRIGVARQRPYTRLGGECRSGGWDAGSAGDTAVEYDGGPWRSAARRQRGPGSQAWPKSRPRGSGRQ